MLNINFVPEDYVASNEFRRANLMYLISFLVVMAVVGAAFMTIRVRQKALDRQESDVNTKMAEAKTALAKFEELQIKRTAMMESALTTAELLEPVPRSILLACMTNNLPAGVSLLKLDFIQKAPKKVKQAKKAPKTKFAKADTQKKAKAAVPQVTGERALETHININGVAPSDLQVAAYIEALGNSELLEMVALVESKEHKVEGLAHRKFRLTAMLAN
ncbi:MAG: PilN domain-containing protein [Planctomycetota bacterium]|jgi:Tfp pilus assembly protein PilN